MILTRYHERARVQREANRAAAPAAAPPQASGGPAATPGPSGSSSVAPPPSKRARREEAARVQRTAFWEAIKEKTASLVGKCVHNFDRILQNVLEKFEVKS